MILEITQGNILLAIRFISAVALGVWALAVVTRNLLVFDQVLALLVFAPHAQVAQNFNAVFREMHEAESATLRALQMKLHER